MENRRHAMLVKPGDASEIVAAVEYIIANPCEAAAIGMNGRQKAMALFDYRAQGQALLSFLQDIC